MSKKRAQSHGKQTPLPANQTAVGETKVQPKSYLASLFSLDRVLVYFAALILFVVIYVPGIPPVTVISGVTEYGYGKTMILVVAVALLSILWLIAKGRKNSWKLQVPWIVLPIAGFILVSILSLVNALNGRVVIQSLLLVVIYAQFGLVLANIVREKRDVTIVLGAIVVGAFLAALYALLQYLGVLQGAPGARGLNRIISFLGNRNFLGGFLAYLLLPSLILVVRLRDPIIRGLALVVIVFNFWMLQIVEQMAPIYGLYVALAALLVGAFAFRVFGSLRKHLRWVIALVVLLTVAFLFAPSKPLNSVVGLAADEEAQQEEQQPGFLMTLWLQNSGRTRELDWWVGLEMFKSSPLIGVGLGNYKLRFLDAKASFLSTDRGADYMSLSIPRAAQAHNEYVQVAAELGTFGVLSLVGFLAVGLWSLWIRLRQATDPSDRMDLLLLAGGLIVFLVHALVSFPGHLAVSALTIAVWIGLMFSKAYGSSGTLVVEVKRMPTLVGLAVAIVAGAVVSAFAISDLSANILMGQGIQRYQISSYLAANGRDQQALEELYAAQDLLERSIRQDFAPRQTYFYLGSILRRKGDLDAALEAYEKCFTRFVDENLYSVYAEVALQMNEPEKARQALDFLLSTNPARALRDQTEYQRASVAIQLGDYNGAVRILEDLRDRSPSYEPAYLGLGNLYAAMRYDALAIEVYQVGLTLINSKIARTIREEANLGGVGTAQQLSTLAQTREGLQRSRDFILEQLETLENR